VGHQELGVGHVAGEPDVLQVRRGEGTQQDRDLPVLDQLVGEPGVAPRDLGRDDREGLRLRRRVQPDAAVAVRDTQAPQPRPVRFGEDLGRQALIRVEPPLPFPIRGDERPDDLIHIAPAGLPHQALLLGKIPVRHLADLVHHTSFLSRAL